MVTSRLICTFVFAYAKSKFSHHVGHMTTSSLNKVDYGLNQFHFNLYGEVTIRHIITFHAKFLTSDWLRTHHVRPRNVDIVPEQLILCCSKFRMTDLSYLFSFCFCLCWSFTAESTTRSCRAGQLIVALFLGRLNPSKQLTSTKRGRPQQ